MKKIFIVFIGILIVSSTYGQWTNLNHSLLSGYNDVGMVYTGTSVLIATNGGIFRSTDNGNTWQRSNTGLDSADIKIKDITYLNNKIWVVSEGLYSSSDDGASWTKNQLNGLSPYGWINSIAKKGNMLFIDYNIWDNVLLKTNTILCYSSNGNNWSYGDTLSYGNNLWWEFLPDNDYALFLTNNNEDTLFYTFDGITLNAFSNLGLQVNSNFNSRSFSIDPLGNNFFYTDGNNPMIYKYNFNTQMWQPKINGLTTYASIFNTHSLGNIVFTTTYNLVPFPSLKLYYSLDTASTWVAVSNPGILFPLFQNSMIRTGSNRIISSDLFNDLCKSDNNGQLWTKNTNIMSLDFTNLIGLNNGNLFAQRDNYGLLKSVDNGTTWTQFNGDLPTYLTLYFANEIVSDGNVMYVTSATQPNGPLGIYKSSNSGTNWVEQTAAPDSSNSVFMGINSGKLFVYFRNSSGIGTYQFTPDQGATWTNISPAINTLALNNVLGFKGNNDTLYLFGRDNLNAKKIYRSTNSGSSFSIITTGLDLPGLEILIGDENDGSKSPIPIASFGANSHNLIVAVRNTNVYPNQLRFYKLNSAQNAWIEISSNGIEMSNNAYINSLQFNNGVWYLATSIGIFVSVNNCLNWTKIWNNQGLQLGMQNRACVVLNDKIFLGTNGTGIWKTQISQPTLTTNVVTDITGTQAKSGGTITLTGGMPFVRKGLCWATHINPTIFDYSVNSGFSQTNFVDTITNLTPSTLYNIKAYIISYNDTIYGNEQSFTTSTITGAQINPANADYGLSNPSNITTNIIWNDAIIVTSIVDNQATPYTLTSNDYSVVGNLLKINHSYLASVLTTAGQSVTLTINFDIGNPVTFVINAVQVFINNAQINPNNVNYDLSLPGPVQTNITWNDASNITSIVDNQLIPYTLLAGDFNLTGNILTIQQSYLSSLLTTSGQIIILTINFNIGNSAVLVINAIEPTITDAVINPTSEVFVTNAPENVKTTITWNDASNISSIIDNQSIPYTLLNSDYSVNADTLIINTSYLTSVIPNVDDSIKLSVNFNVGNSALLKITAVLYVGIVENSNDIALYPNPVSNSLFVSTHSNDVAEISIFNINGQKVYTATQKGMFFTVDVSNLNSGSYMLQYKTDKKIGTYKFVIIK